VCDLGGASLGDAIGFSSTLSGDTDLLLAGDMNEAVSFIGSEMGDISGRFLIGKNEVLL
jgi:hypothetical protein